ncbi:MAG: glycosyltransferase [Planctomycetaceae bacterium]|nr:glycosyltransferase [Planctomycetaceae bacterium]
MAHTPLVSIVVPNYNHCSFLPERIKSIRHQTLTDFEIILLDDASTDGSQDYLNESSQELGATLVVNETNSGGPFGQWNRGVELARGKYVWIAESDDAAEPEFLETLVSVLEAHPEVVLAESNSLRIDESGNVLGPLERWEGDDLQSHWENDYFAAGQDEILSHLYIQNTIPSASAVVFRRATFLESGGADPSFRVSGDWLMWVSLIQNAERFFSAQPLSYSRIHTASQRARSASDGRFEIESLRVQQMLRERMPIDKPLRQRGAFRYAAVRLHSIRSGEMTASLFKQFRFFRGLWQADGCVAIRFLLQLMICLPIGLIKRLLGRTNY